MVRQLHLVETSWRHQARQLAKRYLTRRRALNPLGTGFQVRMLPSVRLQIEFDQMKYPSPVRTRPKQHQEDKSDELFPLHRGWLVLEDFQPEAKRLPWQFYLLAGSQLP